MQKYLKNIQHFLTQTVHLLLYFMLGVSVLSIVLPWVGLGFNFVNWGNFGGFSIACDIIFIERFSFNKRYCLLTKLLPFSMLLINTVNIICNKFFASYYEAYGQLYEVIIFSLTLLIFIVILIEKRLKK